MTEPPLRCGRSPFRVDQICDGDPYELDHGHPIFGANPYEGVFAAP